MVFALEIGSKGTDDVSFTIRIPLVIAPLTQIGFSEIIDPLKLGSYKASIVVGHHPLALEVYGFPTEDAAKQFFPQLVSGLIGTALSLKTGIYFNAQLSGIDYKEPPQIVSEKSNLRLM